MIWQYYYLIRVIMRQGAYKGIFILWNHDVYFLHRVRNKYNIVRFVRLLTNPCLKFTDNLETYNRFWWLRGVYRFYHDVYLFVVAIINSTHMILTSRIELIITIMGLGRLLIENVPIWYIHGPETIFWISQQFSC